jgi:ankyrin repeat protein
MIAAMRGDIERVETLLEYGGAKLDSTDPQNRTPLFYAVEAKEQNEDIVSRMLDGAKPSLINHEARDGSTALYKAVEKEHAKIVELLLEKGANPNISVVPTGE